MILGGEASSAVGANWISLVPLLQAEDVEIMPACWVKVSGIKQANTAVGARGYLMWSFNPYSWLLHCIKVVFWNHNDDLMPCLQLDRCWVLHIIVVLEWKSKLTIYIWLRMLIGRGAVASDAENNNNDQKDYSSNWDSNNKPQDTRWNGTLSLINFVALKTDFTSWSLKAYRASRWTFPTDMSWSLEIAHCWDTPHTCIIHW